MSGNNRYQRLKLDCNIECKKQLKKSNSTTEKDTITLRRGSNGSRLEESIIKNSEFTELYQFYNEIPPSITIASKSLCYLETPFKIGSGFLIKFETIYKDFKCLMTNEHIVNEEIVELKKNILCYIDNNKKPLNIILDKDKRLIKHFKKIFNIDATVIEILPEDNISDNNFLIPNDNYMNYNNNFFCLEGKEITILQYPYGKARYSSGIILKINVKYPYEFSHLASTEFGSSGSPILLKQKSLPIIIGIHKSGSKKHKENYGDLIEPIYKFFKDYKPTKKKNYFTLIKSEIQIPIIKKLNNCWSMQDLFEGKKNLHRYDSLPKINVQKVKNISLNNINREGGCGEENKKMGLYKKGILFYKNGKIKYDGYLVDEKKEGYGKLYYKNGKLKYDGNWFDDKKEGYGKFNHINGEYYWGQWKNDFENGKGILYYKNGKIKYDGYWVKGKKEGKGILYNEDGNIVYNGEWFDDQKDGEGKKYYKNGDYYIGTYKKDSKHGKGILYYNNGRIQYDGYWSYGNKNGKGISYYENGKLKYDGNWANDKKEGYGKYNFKNGECYIGQWKNDFENGKGKLYYKNGKIKYDGNWVIGKKEGKGILYDENRNIIYDGEWKGNKREGKGRKYYENGDYYIGIWKNDVEIGQGILYDEEGRIKFNNNLIRQNSYFNHYQDDNTLSSSSMDSYDMIEYRKTNRIPDYPEIFPQIMINPVHNRLGRNPYPMVFHPMANNIYSYDINNDYYFK